MQAEVLPAVVDSRLVQSLEFSIEFLGGELWTQLFRLAVGHDDLLKQGCRTVSYAATYSVPLRFRPF